MAISIPLPLRLALYYAAYLSAYGIYIPFLPSYLAARGMSAEDIGYLLALIQISRLIGNPLIARAADAWGEARWPLILLSAASLVAFALFPVAQGFAGFFALCFALGLFFTAVPPMMDSLAVSAAVAGGFDYARVRLWGSLAYILAASLGGVLIGRYGAQMTIWLLVIFWILSAGAGFLLPRLPRRAAGEAGMVSLLTDPGFLIMLAASGIIQSSHALLYAFGTIHWLAAGHSAATIGWLWALSVIAEVLLFWAAKSLLRRLMGPELFVIGAAAAVIRWLLAGLGTGLPLLILVQCLHGFTFAATHLAAMTYLARRTPPGLAATAQMLQAIAVGSTTGLVTLGTGALYAAFGGHAFFVMAAIAALGLVLALKAMGKEAWASL